MHTMTRVAFALTAALTVALPFAAFAQAPAPAEFVAAALAGDSGAMKAMLDADPALASSVDDSGEPVAFLALSSGRPAETLALLLAAGLSPETVSRDSGEALLLEAVYRGDLEALRVVVAALDERGPDAWARPYTRARQQMDNLEDMQRRDILALATRTSPKGSSQDHIDQRATWMNKGRDLYPDMRAAMAAAFVYPVWLIAEGYGAYTMTLWPQTDSILHEDDEKGGFVPDLGVALSVFFMHGDVWMLDGQEHARPVWSAGAYVTAYDAMPPIANMVIVAGGLEFDLMRIAYARIGGGYLFPSVASMDFTLTRNELGIDEYQNFSVPLAGPMIDMSFGFRIPMDALELSIAFPIHFRVGFPALEGVDAWDGEIRQLYMGFGLSLGLGYVIN